MRLFNMDQDFLLGLEIPDMVEIPVIFKSRIFKMKNCKSKENIKSKFYKILVRLP